VKIQFISNYSQLYGANKVLLSILEHFQSRNYKISVLLPSKGGMSDKLEQLKIPYTIIPYFSSFLYIKYSFKYLTYPFLVALNFFLFPKILFSIKKFNPDIIYSNTSAENIGIIVAKLLNIKHISHVHEFMSLDHGAFFITGRKAKNNYINKSDGVIYVSQSVANYVTINKPLTEKQTVILNGVGSPEINIKEKAISHEINFGIVGILARGKGQHLAIKYFKEVVKIYPNSKLHVFGDKNGSYKKYLKKLVLILKLEDNIIFHGFINNADDIYNKIDVLFMFSRSEGFGLVTVEAMLHGVPVIGFDNAGTSELIEDKVTGYLFQDKQSFLTCVKSLLSDDNYNIVRNNALKIAILKFNIQSYCSEIERFVVRISL